MKETEIDLKETFVEEHTTSSVTKMRIKNE